MRNFSQQFKQVLPRPVRRSASNILHVSRTLSASKRCFPDFIIIGAQKAGTTSLYQYLTQHPQIVSAVTKEVHFFDINYHKGTLWYRTHFPFQWKIKETGITGEASPCYLLHPHTPKRIAQLLPDVKLIVLLRNPVDRAVSHYFHEVRHNREELAIEKAFEMEERRIEPELDKMLSEEFYHSNIYQRYSYKKRGIYIDQLRNYMKYFEREQIMVINSDKFFRDTRKVLREVLSFLGLKSDFTSGDLSPQYVGTYTQKISPSFRQYLKFYFALHNRRLFEYIGQDFGWK